MVIGICDDDKQWRESCKRTLEGFSLMIELTIEIKCFATARELLEYKGTPLDAVFLDIELGRENGIFVAKKLNKAWPSCQIIYMSNYLHYATEIYNTEHIWFVVKKHFQDKVGEIISRILRDFEGNTFRIVLTTLKNEVISIVPLDIYYLEREKRGTRIVTVWNEYHVKERMRDIVPQLSELDFSQCHNSYVVNFRHVKELQKDMYILYGGAGQEQIVQISRRYVQKTRKDFLKWSSLFV